MGAEADSRSFQVQHRNAHYEQRSDEDDDVARSAFGQDERSVQPNHANDDGGEIEKPSRRHPPDDVVREMEGSKEDREQGKDG